MVGTLATHKLAAAPALKAPFVAAEKMEPFMACAPCLVALPPVEPAISVLVASRLLSPPLRAKMTTEKMALPTKHPLESALSRHFIISRLPVRTPPTRALVQPAVARAGHFVIQVKMPEEKVKMLGDKMPEEKDKKDEKKPPKSEKKPPQSTPPSPLAACDKGFTRSCTSLQLSERTCPGYSCGCADKAKRVPACPPSPPSPPSPPAPPECDAKYNLYRKKDNPGYDCGCAGKPACP